jgi:hypothetical protein
MLVFMSSWIAPDFVEIKMDAEIGSYQEDTDPVRDDFVGDRAPSEDRD